MVYKAPDMSRTADHIASRNQEDVAGPAGLDLAHAGYL
jgi:hypothetical protein